MPYADPKDAKAASRRRYLANRDQRKANAKATYYRNRERLLANKRVYNIEKKTEIRYATLFRKFGITAEQYENLFRKQGGHCAICPAVVADCRGGALAVDHNHTTGKVRGLLCHPCNKAYGVFEKHPKGFTEYRARYP